MLGDNLFGLWAKTFHVLALYKHPSDNAVGLGLTYLLLLGAR